MPCALALPQDTWHRAWGISIPSCHSWEARRGHAAPWDGPGRLREDTHHATAQEGHAPAEHGPPLPPPPVLPVSGLALVAGLAQSQHGCSSGGCRPGQEAAVAHTPGNAEAAQTRCLPGPWR